MMCSGNVNGNTFTGFSELFTYLRVRFFNFNMNSSIFKGLIIIAVGAFVIFWTVDHSPHAPVGQQITDILDSNEYRMTEFWYYTCLLVGSLIAIFGIRKLLK